MTDLCDEADDYRGEDGSYRETGDDWDDNWREPDPEEVPGA